MVNEQIVKYRYLASSDFDHPIKKTTPKKGLEGRFGKFFMVATFIFLTNVAPFKGK